jgi:mannose-1-phosphate guanylyltransferase/mannose-6-phosphate isomerase
MLQETLLRMQGIEPLGAPVILCNHQHRFQVADQLEEIEASSHALILEPMARNTCAATATAALKLAQDDPQALMIALPSDHVISDVSAFHRAISVAREVAATGRVALFGIVPHKPETGFGYIQMGSRCDGDVEPAAHEIVSFVEKPDEATARKYLAAGNYLWNSGMFVARVDVLLEELEAHAPQVLAVCREALETASKDLDFLRLNAESFKNCPSISMDCAVLEQTARSVVIPIDMGWSDVGSWSALWDHYPKDEQGNVQQGDVLAHNTKNCFISSHKRLVTTLGVQDLIIVETSDAVLVAHKDSAQDVKVLVDKLLAEKRSEVEHHRRVYRPWGSYEGIDKEARFQVKRIIVKPDAHLSLQKHFHRSEHWIVVSGTAQVTCGDQVRLVSENESVYIPLGSLHSLHNPGSIPLHLIEVQSGAYLGEDDIVRVKDLYGRLDDTTSSSSQSSRSDAPANRSSYAAPIPTFGVSS